jgi:hypothetical protein
MPYADILGDFFCLDHCTNAMYNVVPNERESNVLIITTP